MRTVSIRTALAAITASIALSLVAGYVVAPAPHDCREDEVAWWVADDVRECVPLDVLRR